MGIEEILGTESPGLEPSESALEGAALALAAVGANRRNARRQTTLARLSVFQQRKLRALGVDLGNGDISTSRYTEEFTQEIQIEHTAAAAIFRGNLADLTEADERIIRSRVTSETGFLGRLVISWLGGQVTQGRLAARSQMYGAAVRPTFYEVGTADFVTEGFELERNILAPVDNCQGVGSCIGETARGLVTIDTLIPIGNRVCLSNCQCRLEIVDLESETRVIL